MWLKGIYPGENALREDIDAVVAARPVCLMDRGGDTCWCDTKALEISGVIDRSVVIVWATCSTIALVAFIATTKII